jgi:protein TonB
MEFRNNIIFSAIAHATIFTAALALAGRGPAPRPAEKYVAVTLLEPATAQKPAPKDDAQKDTSPPRTRTSSRLREAAPPEVPLPAAVQKEPTDVVPSKRANNPRKDAGPTESGPVTGGAKASPGQTGGPPAASDRKMDLTISATASTRQAIVGPKGNAAGGNAGIVDAIRTAIERAKSYPPLARKRGIEGTVTAEFTINTSGYPENIRIVRSSGHDILDDAARKTLLRASPYPPVKGTLEVPITFRIER